MRRNSDRVDDPISAVLPGSPGRRHREPRRPRPRSRNGPGEGAGDALVAMMAATSIGG